ncbi:MAG: tetraacyldisaccharide 4'-kinase [Pirellulales bacterium]
MSLLPDAATYRALVDGSRTGAMAGLLRGLLAGCSVPYGAAVIMRNLLYDTQLLKATAADVPVICVGNLTLGGTGKTPLVAWLARLLLEFNTRPAIVSRGYAASAGSVSDEAAELAMLLPGVGHVANRDRVAGVKEAIDQHAARIAILDDGFQHRRLARTLDLVAVDATDPFGCGHLFPRGLLREPLSGWRRADAVILTRSSSVDAARRATIKANVLRRAVTKRPVWAETTHAPRCLRTAEGRTSPLTMLTGTRVAIVSGIGNPHAFRNTVASTGCVITSETILPDHHHYKNSDLAQLGRAARTTAAELIVTTVKDLVKIRETEVHGVPIMALEIAIEFLQGEADLRALIDRAVALAPHDHSTDA